MSQYTPGREGKSVEENMKRGGEDLANEAKEAAQKVAQRVKEGATEVMEDVRSQVRDQAVSAMHQQQELIADKIDCVCEAVNEAARKLREDEIPAVAGLIEQGASQIEALSNYIREHEFSDMLDGAQGWIRRNPAIFLGGSFVLGLLIARVIKSAQSPQGGSTYGGGSSLGEEGEFGGYESSSRFASSQYGSAFTPTSGVGQSSTEGGWEEP